MNDLACSLIEALSAPGLAASKSWLEVVYWIGGITVAIFAFLAYRQRAKLEGAKLLLDLEKEWHELGNARKEVYEILNKIRRDVFTNHAHLTDASRIIMMKKEVCTELKKLQNEDIDRYLEIIQFLSFFEKMGFLVKQKFVAYKYVDGLYRGPILDSSIFFGEFIEEWENVPGVPPGVFEYALYLFKRANRSSKLLGLWRW